MSRQVADAAVRVEGLAELQRALRQLSSEFPKEMRLEGKAIATDVADDARSRAFSLGGVAAKTAPSIKASAGARFAGVAFGGPAYPFAGGAEFGSIRYSQFKPWRGNSSDAGYFVYPSIRDQADSIEERYLEALGRITDKAGLT